MRKMICTVIQGNTVPCITEKIQIRLPGASKFCSWESENGNSVVQWRSKISLISLVIVYHCLQTVPSK